MSPKSTLLFAGGGTGGHVYPMIAVAEAVRSIAPELKLVFVGTARGLEAKIVPERGFELELLEVLPIRGGGLRGAVKGATRAALLLPEARALLKQLSPAAVFSVGGYAAGPVSLAAWFAGVPLALLEPNSVIGLANRVVAPIVDRAYTAFPESEKHFKKGRVLRAGVPIRQGFSAQPYQAAEALRILVLGGSQGAKALNENVPQALARTTVDVRVVHQCGPGHDEAVRALYGELGLAARATVVSFIDDMPRAIAGADLIVGRSGASAVSEICAVGRPSILVPYPFAAGDHQRMNALSLEQAGAAECVASADASAERLASEIERLAGDRSLLSAMAHAAQSLGRPDAARAIAIDLLQLAGLESGASESKSDRDRTPSSSADLRHDFSGGLVNV
ncbi:MAG TPA: undecaprenyldiphospho-muramoylpentapeptide beta-N-acetylglucosaminyltransferase [Polyangiaceae bacterium]|nr:undecaprenyldiphospho-muramoylpentapeptide beta-N-acetylglucosaminyltransferase [Polyangiaceae bacterium]